MFNSKLFKDKNIHNQLTIKSVDMNIEFKEDNAFVSHQDFLTFIFKNKIDVIDKVIKCPIIIGTDNKMYSEEFYNKWLFQLNENDFNSIDYNDLKIGYVYQLEDKNSYFLYLGLKHIISWKFDKKTNEIILSKPKKEFLGYTVYKHDNYDNTQYYHKSSFKLTKKVIKEVKKYDGKLDLETLNLNIKYDKDYIYFSDEKAPKDFFYSLKKVSIEDLEELSKKANIHHINLFLKSGNYFLKNNYFLYEESFKTKKDEFSRHISKWDYNSCIFSWTENGTLKLFKENISYPEYNCKLYSLTEQDKKNDNFRIGPADYYLLELEF